MPIALLATSVEWMALIDHASRADEGAVRHRSEMEAAVLELIAGSAQRLGAVRLGRFSRGKRVGASPEFHRYAQRLEVRR